MANKNILQVDGGQTTVITGGRIYMILPAATPSGFQDYWIAVSDFQADITSDISSIQSDITTIDLQINDLQILTSYLDYADVSASFSIPISAGNEVESIVAEWISATPTIKVGTSAGAHDLSGMEITVPSTGTKRCKMSIDYPSAADHTIYITLTGGHIKLFVFLKYY
jgi:hypothetical protein